MKYLKATLLGSGALASLLLSSVLTSCQDEDFGFTSEEIRAAAYDRNFIAHFGEIEPDMDWDLTRQVVGAFDDRTRALGSSGIEGEVSTLSDWYYVDSKVVETFNDLLPEADKSNKQKGTTGFHLESQGTFYIIPVYQGQSGLASDLWMHVEYEGKEADINLWQRSKDIQRQTVGSFGWRDLRYDWKALFGDDCSWTYFSTIDWYTFFSHGEYIASTRAAAGIRTKPIKCEIPVGAKIDFFLKITTGHVNYGKFGSDYDRISATGINNYDTEWQKTHDYSIKSTWSEANLAITGDEMWASKGKMIQLNQVDGLTIPDIEKLAGEGAKYMFIACEDAISKGELAGDVQYDSYRPKNNFSNKDNENHPEMYSLQNDKIHVKLSPNDWEGDDDMNDLVFLFVSAKLPEVKDATTIKKRYIIEDLGSIVDWDFNDIVVDMEQVKTTNGSIQQKATLKHLCGTTPFELFVGETNDESNSVKLDFGGDGLNKVTMGSKQVIDGQVLDQSVELNYEFYLPEAKWNPTTNNIWVKVYPKDRYSNSKHPESEYEYTGTPGADNYGGSTTGPTNGAVGNGEINATFDYGTFISFAFPRKGKVPRIIAVNPDHEWTAEHHDINPDIWTVYKVTVGKTGNGDVWGEGIYKPNTSIEISAKAEEGYRFVKWNDGNTNAKRTVTVTANTDYTAEFTPLTAEWEMPNSNASLTGYNSKEISGTDFTTALSYGYNTIVLYSDKACDFGLAINGGVDYVVYGDAVNYHVTNQNGTYKTEIVLTDAQLTAIKNNLNKFSVRARGSETTLTKVTLKKTENKFTVNLLPIENWGTIGTVEASDRASGSWGSDDGNPYVRNGGNAFKEASYAAGQTVTLTPKAQSRYENNQSVQDYVFDHWEQYDAVENGNIINIDKGGTNGAITVESSAILKAVFKQKGKLTYISSTGEAIQIGYRESGSTGAYTSISSGVGTEKLGSSKKTYEFQVISVKQNNTEITKLDDGETDRYMVDWTNGSDTKAVGASKNISYEWDPDKGLALNLAVRYYVNPVRKLGNNIDNTPGKVTIRVKGSDDIADNLMYVAAGTEVELNAVHADGYKFVDWADGTATSNRSITITEPKVIYANFKQLELSNIWSGNKYCNNGEAFQFAYGTQNQLLNQLPSSGIAKLKITFNSSITGDIRFMTPYQKKNGSNFEGGWTAFNPDHIFHLNNQQSFETEFTADEIAAMKELGGLIIQNVTQASYTITKVDILK